MKIVKKSCFELGYTRKKLLEPNFFITFYHFPLHLTPLAILLNKSKY